MDRQHRCIPSYPDWVWFGQRTDAELAELANAPQANGVRWFQEAYRWLFDRRKACHTANSLPEPRALRSGGPGRELVPVLADSERGQLGFLTIDSLRKYGRPVADLSSQENSDNVYIMAKYIFDLFRKLEYDLGDPIPELHLPAGGGTSLSLPAMMGAMSRILGTYWPQTLVATGCFTGEKLACVSPDSLTNKMTVAKRFGYTTLVVVEGQEFPVPMSAVNLEIKYVRSDPVSAMRDLLDLAEQPDESAESVAKLLAIYAKDNVQGEIPFSELEKQLQPYITSRFPLVRHVACDICSRYALHQGMTQEAQSYRIQEESLCWNEYPSGWLGHYLRFEEIASHAVIAIDAGLWNEQEEIHQKLNERYDHLLRAQKGEFADAADVFDLMALSNTRGQRRQYLARMNQSNDLLRLAWNDFYLLHDNWESIFDYCEKVGRTDSTWERQRNYCIAALVDVKQMNIPWYELNGAEDFLHVLTNEQFDSSNAYDLIARIHSVYLTNPSPSKTDVSALFNDAVSLFKQGRGVFNYLPTELLLRYGWGTNEERCNASKLLETASLLSPTLPSSSILTLLAIRLRAVLAHEGITVPGNPVLPPEGTPLRHWADELLASSAQAAIDRCPY
ncbi:MAG: hypothetical protein Q4G59_02290 [Planctomycetia bacterium]|nr:hypothetical protein [Planctomycetia bacterium]